MGLRDRRTEVGRRHSQEAGLEPGLEARREAQERKWEIGARGSSRASPSSAPHADLSANARHEDAKLLHQPLASPAGDKDEHHEEALPLDSGSSGAWVSLSLSTLCSPTLSPPLQLLLVHPHSHSSATPGQPGSTPMHQPIPGLLATQLLGRPEPCGRGHLLLCNAKKPTCPAGGQQILTVQQFSELPTRVRNL